MRGWIAITCLYATGLSAGPADFERANQLYERTEYGASLKLLLPLTPNATVQEAIGKNYFMLGEFKKAQEYFERAIAADPKSSDSSPAARRRARSI